MKIIFIRTIDDYGFLSFKDDYKGWAVKQIIQKISDGHDLDNDAYEVEIHEVGEVSDTFIEFTRNYLIDYDQGKHENFLTEEETV